MPIGPLVAGDRGATYLAMTDGAPVARLVEGDPADAGLERHGLTPLPDPSNSIEDWLAHTVRPTPNTEGS